MFWRRSKGEEAAAAQEQPPVGKGRPTPKRSEAQARNRRPLVADDRREASRRSREERRRDQARVLEAYETENQQFLPERDRGPVRRFVRDFVDARRSIGQYFLPAALVILVPSLLPNLLPESVPSGLLVLVTSVALYTLLGMLLLDSFLLSRTVISAVRERFGEEAAKERGLRMYAVGRAFQMRRTRRPKPKVTYGQQPR